MSIPALALIPLLLSPVVFAAVTDDDRAVRKVIDDFNAHRRARDAAKMASLYTENADYWPREEMPAVHGRAEIQKRFEGVFQGRSADDRDRVVRGVRFVRPDVAIVRTAADTPNERMVDIFVIVKEGSGWKIGSRHTARVELPRTTGGQ
jgi:uncharacterized protein (TIGR02246 family)